MEDGYSSLTSGRSIQTQMHTPNIMDSKHIDSLFSPETLQQLFPKERADDFFDALFGDASEGAYDIELGYGGSSRNTIRLELRLHERPGRCLACNLTQGLPQVFERHPVINVSGMVAEIDKMLGDQAKAEKWSLGFTEQRQKELHIIPLTIELT